MRHAKPLREHVQSLVQCPQSGALRDQGRGEQVHVDNAAAEAEQVFAVDESQYFGRAGLTGGLQAGEVGQCLRAVRRGATGQFADDQRVDHYEVAIQKPDERIVTVAEVIHPHRGIDKDSAHWGAPVRVRGMSGMSGSVAPSAASRLADCTLT